MATCFSTAFLNHHDSYTTLVDSNLRRYLGSVLHELASHKESRIYEGHMSGDHLHMLISIPPKYAVSQVVGYIKGKSAIHIARQYIGKRKNYTG